MRVRLSVDFFKLERNGEIIDERVSGFFCSSKHPDSIQLYENDNLTETDWLIHNNTTRKYFIDKVTPLTSGCIAHYQTEYDYLNKKESHQQINIGSIAGNAIVGNQQYATINIGASFNEIRQFVQGSTEINPEDKESFEKLLCYAESIIENNTPVSKGSFEKYADLAAKHSQTFSSIINVFGAWLLGGK